VRKLITGKLAGGSGHRDCESPERSRGDFTTGTRSTGPTRRGGSSISHRGVPPGHTTTGSLAAYRFVSFRIAPNIVPVLFDLPYCLAFHLSWRYHLAVCGVTAELTSRYRLTVTDLVLL